MPIFHDSRELQAWEADQALRGAPSEAMDWWIRKHFGACPHCGSHDGMVSWYRDELAGQPPNPDEIFYQYADGTDVIVTPCPHCQTDLTSFHPLTYAQVMNWLAGP